MRVGVQPGGRDEGRSEPAGYGQNWGQVVAGNGTPWDRSNSSDQYRLPASLDITVSQAGERDHDSGDLGVATYRVSEFDQSSDPDRGGYYGTSEDVPAGQQFAFDAGKRLRP